EGGSRVLGPCFGGWGDRRIRGAKGDAANPNSRTGSGRIGHKISCVEAVELVFGGLRGMFLPHLTDLPKIGRGSAICVDGAAPRSLLRTAGPVGPPAGLI